MAAHAASFADAAPQNLGCAGAELINKAHLYIVVINVYVPYSVGAEAIQDRHCTKHAAMSGRVQHGGRAALAAWKE